MFVMHETAADRTGTGVEIFVTAPHREIDLPVVQVQHHIAGGVGQIDAEHATLTMGRLRQPRDVEILARQEIDAAQQHQGDLGAALGEQRLNVRAASLTPQQSRARVKAVMTELRLQRIQVRGKDGGVDQDTIARGSGPIECQHQQMQVGRQAVHEDDFACLRRPAALRIRGNSRGTNTRESCPGNAPRRRGLPMRPVPARPAPRRARLQSQRVTAEIDDRLTIGAARDVELLAEMAQRISGVQAEGEGLIRLKAHDGVPHRAASMPRNSRAVPLNMRSRNCAGRSVSDSMSLPGSCSPSGKG